MKPAPLKTVSPIMRYYRYEWLLQTLSLMVMIAFYNIELAANRAQGATSLVSDFTYLIMGFVDVIVVTYFLVFLLSVFAALRLGIEAVGSAVLKGLVLRIIPQLLFIAVMGFVLLKGYALIILQMDLPTNFQSMSMAAFMAPCAYCLLLFIMMLNYQRIGVLPAVVANSIRKSDRGDGAGVTVAK